MRIGITFAIFNKIEFTLSCLESIYKNNCDDELYIVIVNNASTDNSKDIIKQKYPDVNFIDNKENMGCSFAWNQGVKECIQSKCEYIILMQNDIILSNQLINNCKDFLNCYNFFDIVAPEAINKPHDHGKIITQEQLNVIYDDVKIKYKESIETPFGFFFFMCRKNIFETFSFDENFKQVLYEDIDFFNNIICSEILTCKSINLGLIYHRFSATQSIARNSNTSYNKRYFEHKWLEKEDIIKKHRQNIEEKINKNGVVLKRQYLLDTNNGFDVEKEGYFNW